MRGDSGTKVSDARCQQKDNILIQSDLPKQEVIRKTNMNSKNISQTVQEQLFDSFVTMTQLFFASLLGLPRSVGDTRTARSKGGFHGIIPVYLNIGISFFSSLSVAAAHDGIWNHSNHTLFLALAYGNCRGACWMWLLKACLLQTVSGLHCKHDIKLDRITEQCRCLEVLKL